ncbi:MAG: SDR family oxidoreductase [Desulfobulbaceae bacterium]|nr:SDR family oxidoreductase [Desulfobulbaceae bacterium]
MKIEGKTALVAGASRGIGLAIARKLAAEGARLILPWFDWPEDSESMQREFSSTDGCHSFILADLRKSSDVKDMAEMIRRNRGSLHILINNIERGGMPVIHGSYELEVNRDQWQLEMETTLHAKHLLFEYCFPLMKEEQDAAIINISSIAGLTGRSGPAGLIYSDGYAAANCGISTLTKTWARLAAPNVRVNEIMLGLIDTRHGRRTRGWEKLTEQERSDLIGHTLLKRTGTPEEVAETVLFLIKNAAYMTGAVIRLDGGFLLGGEKIPPLPKGIL